MPSLQLVIRTEETQSRTVQNLVMDATKTKEAAIELSNYFHNLATGNSTGVIDIRTASADPVAASATITLVSVPANDTVTIGGTVFTASATPSGNVQFSQAGTDAQDAASLASIINAHPTVGEVFIATSAANVVTVAARSKGVHGNFFAISRTGTAMTLSGALFTGGTGGATDAVTTYNLGM